MGGWGGITHRRVRPPPPPHPPAPTVSRPTHPPSAPASAGPPRLALQRGGARVRGGAGRERAGLALTAGDSPFWQLLRQRQHEVLSPPPPARRWQQRVFEALLRPVPIAVGRLGRPAPPPVMMLHTARWSRSLGPEDQVQLAAVPLPQLQQLPPAGGTRRFSRRQRPRQPPGPEPTAGPPPPQPPTPHAAPLPGRRRPGRQLRPGRWARSLPLGRERRSSMVETQKRGRRGVCILAYNHDR